MRIRRFDTEIDKLSGELLELEAPCSIAVIVVSGVLQSLRIQGSHLSEKIGLPCFQIAFCLSQIQSSGWLKFLRFLLFFKTALFDL